MAIQIQNLTDGTVSKAIPTKPVWEGSGVLDVLIKAVNENINIQYETNRITGADYANVYIASLDTCIKEAINFLLQKEAIDADTKLKNAEIALKNAEIALKTAELPLKTAELAIRNAEVGAIQAEVLLKTKELELKDAEITLKEKELDLKDAEIELKTFQKLGVEADAALKNAQAVSYPSQAAADLEVKAAQVELYDKQKAGFDDNRRQKLFEATINSWALAYSSGILDTTKVPAFINDTDMTTLFTTIKNT
jgi:hypothetical protein